MIFELIWIYKIRYFLEVLYGIVLMVFCWEKVYNILRLVKFCVCRIVNSVEVVKNDDFRELV